MTRKFDRSDYDSRHLKNAFREMGERLAQEAAGLRAEVHERYYPNFGVVGGTRKKVVTRRFKMWDDIFRDCAEKLFRYAYEVEQKLVYTMAVETRSDTKTVFDSVRSRKKDADLLLRAIAWRLKKFETAETIDTEQLYDFCALTERAAMFLQFISMVLFAIPGQNALVRDPGLLNLDLDELKTLGEKLPSMIRGEEVEPPKPQPRPAPEAKPAPKPTAAKGTPENPIPLKSQPIPPRPQPATRSFSGPATRMKTGR